MADAISIALSGLSAQGQRLAATANNIANVSTAGVVPTPESPVSTVYRPLSVSFTALMAGGVSASVIEDPDGYTAVSDPNSVYANSEGLIAVPNVDLAQESVNLLETKLAYKANLKTIKTQNEMLGELLNAIT